MTWEIERDRFGVMFSGPLEVGECVKVVAAADYERLRESARAALNVLGAVHRVTEGPRAGWHDDGDHFYYDEDHVPHPDCVVCAAERDLKATLGDDAITTNGGK